MDKYRSTDSSVRYIVNNFLRNKLISLLQKYTLFDTWFDCIQNSSDRVLKEKIEEEEEEETCFHIHSHRTNHRTKVKSDDAVIKYIDNSRRRVSSRRMGFRILFTT